MAKLKQETRLYRPIKITLMVLLLLLFIDLSHTRIGTSTTYDGVTYNANKYLGFIGDGGLRIDEAMKDITAYTFSIWIRITETPLSIKRSFMIA